MWVLAKFLINLESDLGSDVEILSINVAVVNVFFVVDFKKRESGSNLS